jgi:hypothetical protein
MDDGNYLIAGPDRLAFFIYDRNHELIREIPLNIKQRPVRESDLGYHLRNEPKEARRILKKMVSEFKPPFLNVWVSQDYVLLHTDNSKNGKEMVVLTLEGDPVGNFYLSEFDDVRYFKDNRIYALYKNPQGLVKQTPQRGSSRR